MHQWGQGDRVLGCGAAESSAAHRDKDQGNDCGLEEDQETSDTRFNPEGRK